jgi:hypothetical protein
VAVRRRCDAALQAHCGSERDHRAVVGAQRQLREEDPDLALVAFAHQPLAQCRVGADAAGDDQPLQAGPLERGDRLAHEDVDDRLLCRRRQVRARLIARRVEPGGMVAHGGFQAGEREVERLPVEQGSGQRVGVRVAEFGEPRQRRASGIAEAEQLGRLVERLAGGVIDGVAEQSVAADVGHLEQLRVAARDEQRDEGERRRISGEKRRQEMTFQVMDTYGRSVQRGGY